MTSEPNHLNSFLLIEDFHPCDQEPSKIDDWKKKKKKEKSYLTFIFRPHILHKLINLLWAWALVTQIPSCIWSQWSSIYKIMTTWAVRKIELHDFMISTVDLQRPFPNKTKSSNYKNLIWPWGYLQAIITMSMEASVVQSWKKKKKKIHCPVIWHGWSIYSTLQKISLLMQEKGM